MFMKASSLGIFFIRNVFVKECLQMKLNKLIKTAIKYGPIVYPIIKKMMDNKKSTPQPATTRRTPKR